MLLDELIKVKAFALSVWSCFLVSHKADVRWVHRVSHKVTERYFFLSGAGLFMVTVSYNSVRILTFKKIYHPISEVKKLESLTTLCSNNSFIAKMFLWIRLLILISYYKTALFNEVWSYWAYAVNFNAWRSINRVKFNTSSVLPDFITIQKRG